METAVMPPEKEMMIGLERYYTTERPIGGKLKLSPEDFIVSEISDKPKEDKEGRFTIATITVKNWETNRLIKILSNSLAISKRSIGFAGTKDKRAITTQLMSFKADPRSVSSLSIKDVEISNIYRSNRELTIGDLFGNQFDIKIRNINLDEKKLNHRTSNVIDQITSIGGFPNYFGIQRFGSVRPITHIIGKYILKKEFEKAVMTYVANPLEDEPDESHNARSILQKDKDFKAATDYYPKYYSFERSMIVHLAKYPEDWIGALNTAPDNLKMMFIHAYQSFIFNKILSERMKRGFPLDRAIEGDIILPLNKKNLPDHHRYIKVDSKNIDEMNDLLSRKLGFISGLLMGINENYAEGEMGDIERKISKIDGITNSDFNIQDIEGLSSKGIRREILCPIFDLKWRTLKDISDTNQIQLKFSLYRGSYATSFLREILKGDVLDY